MKKLLVLLLLFPILVLFTTIPAFAQDSSKPQKTIILPENEIIDGNYYNAGDLIEIMGTINGDVYLIGGQIIVSGTINGDLLVAGGTVTINGNISEDVRAAGGQVYIDAQIGDDLSLVGGNLEISNKTNIGGGSQIAGGNVILSGQIEKELYAGAGNLTLTSSAAIGKDLNYAAGEDSQISTDAKIGGEKNRYGKFKYTKDMSIQKFMSATAETFTAITKLMSIVTTLALALLLILLVPKYSQKGKDMVLKSFWKSAGVGFVSVIAAPIVFIVIAITFLGLPLALLFSFAFFWFFYLGRILVMLAIGEKLVQFYRKSPSLWLSFLAGGLIYYLITPLPLIGGILKLIVVIIGGGATLITQYQVFQESKKAKII